MITDPASLAGAFDFTPRTFTIAGLEPTQVLPANPNRIALWVSDPLNIGYFLGAGIATTSAFMLRYTNTNQGAEFVYPLHGGICQQSWTIVPFGNPQDFAVWELCYYPERLSQNPLPPLY